MNGVLRRHVALAFCAWTLSSGLSAGAELQERTIRAYETYRATAERQFFAHQHTPGTPLSAGITGRPGAQDGIISIAGGLIHHWFGTCFIPGVNLQTAIDVSRNYERYPSIYKQIVASRVLDSEANKYRVLIRMKDGDGGISAVLDVRSTVRYILPDTRHAFTIAHSDEIREVRRAGTPDEMLLPPGRDSGYLWRVDLFTAFTQTADGLYIETDTLGLSRPFPPMLSWLIAPIVRRFGRRSVVVSLEQFEAAAMIAAARGE